METPFIQLSEIAKSKIFWASIGIFGGIARMLNDILNKKEEFSWSRIFMKAIVSGFFGYMGGESAQFVSQPQLGFMAAGLVGYLGSEGFDYIVQIVRNRYIPPKT